MVIKATELYGAKEVVDLIDAAACLAQTAETIDWAVQQLKTEAGLIYDPKVDDYPEGGDFLRGLSILVAQADLDLVRPRLDEIVSYFAFAWQGDVRLRSRLKALELDKAACWRELERLSKKGHESDILGGYDPDGATDILEALARLGGDSEEDIRRILTTKANGKLRVPSIWMQKFAIRLAGRLRIESLVPLINAKLLEDVDSFGDDAVEALSRIATPSVVHLIAETYPDAYDGYRMHSAIVLENIHTDLSVETCLKLLAFEQELDLRCCLVEALLFQNCDEGIKAAREELTVQFPHDIDVDIPGMLLETCDLMGIQIPEYDELAALRSAAATEEMTDFEEIDEDLADDFRQVLDQLGQLRDDDEFDSEPDLNPIPLSGPPPAPAAFQPPPAPITLRRDGPKVGRNDPCPCGSGKKFKQCCLKKQ